MPITNTDIAVKISDLVDKWQLREDEMINWLAGTATGGPASNGQYPLTDVLGVVTMVSCPAKFSADIGNTLTGSTASATAAAVSAANAALSATAASTSATASSGSAASASGSATTATTAKNNALNSEANSLTSANNAAASATSAAASATNAAASYDSFDDRYLGSKATAPTLDNDGNALLIGALYWDTAISGLRAYNGSAWITYAGITAAGLANTPSGGIAATNVQAAINELDAEKANLASPVFTGNPAAPTAAQFDIDTSIATTAYAMQIGLRSNYYQDYSGSATLTAADFGRVARYNSGSVGTLTLPNVSVLGGSIIAVSNINIGACTIAQGGSELIYALGSMAVTSITLQKGDSVLLAATGGVWIQVAGSNGIGNGQSWLDMTASRAMATTYTNTTGKSIMVTVATISTATTSSAFLINGAVRGSGNSGAAGTWLAASTIVPNAATYSYIVGSGTPSLQSWMELR